MSMKAKKWTFLLTSIATLALVTACTQSTSNTTASNTATSTTSTTNAKKTSYFTDKERRYQVMELPYQDLPLQSLSQVPM